MRVFKLAFWASSAAAASLTSQAVTTSAPTHSCPSALPLVNPGFESGKRAPWVATFYHPGIPEESVNASIVAPGHPGRYKLQVAWVRFVYGVYTLTQTVPGLCAGKTYLVSFGFQFHDWNIAYNPDECQNTVELVGATATADTTFGPYNSTVWHHFSGHFKANTTGVTNLTVTTTCRTDPDEDSTPGWEAWYDNFKVVAVS